MARAVKSFIALRSQAVATAKATNANATTPTNGSLAPPIPGITIENTASGDNENLLCTAYGTGSFQPTGSAALTQRFARCPYSCAGRSCSAAGRNMNVTAMMEIG